MKRLACLVLIGAAASAQERIEWSASMDAARAQSKRDGRPVLLYFTFET